MIDGNMKALEMAFDKAEEAIEADEMSLSA